MALPLVPPVTHRVVDVDGVGVFTRQVGPPDAPTLLLLHGAATASHQFTRLVDALGHRFRLVAPDYPGFGRSDLPPGGAPYTFERLAGIVDGLCDRLGLDRFVPYLFDYGAPVGFRLALRHPERIAGLVVQNGNAYDEGLSAGARTYAAARRGVPADEAALRSFLGPDGVRAMYEVGVADPATLDPDGWALDLAHLAAPGRLAAQLDLAFDYGANVASYPAWQAWLRRHRPPTLVAWGRHDEVFLEAGAHAYRRDVPDAELHLLDTGHSALATHAHEVAPLVADFLDRTWAPRPPAPALSPSAPSGTS